MKNHDYTNKLDKKCTLIHTDIKEKLKNVEKLSAELDIIDADIGKLLKNINSPYPQDEILKLFIEVKLPLSRHLNFQDVSIFLSSLIIETVSLSPLHLDRVKEYFSHLVSHVKWIRSQENLCIDIQPLTYSHAHGDLKSFSCVIVSGIVSSDDFYDVEGLIIRNYFSVISGLAGEYNLSLDPNYLSLWACSYADFLGTDGNVELWPSSVHNMCRMLHFSSLMSALCIEERDGKCSQIQAEGNKINLFLNFPLCGSSSLISKITEYLIIEMSRVDFNAQGICKFLQPDDAGCINTKVVDVLKKDMNHYLNGLRRIKTNLAGLIIMEGGINLSYRSSCTSTVWAYTKLTVASREGSENREDFMATRIALCDRFLHNPKEDMWTDDIDERRFTIIHELTHALLGTNDGVDGRTYGATKCCIEYEVYKNQFKGLEVPLILSADCLAAIIYYYNTDYNYHNICNKGKSLFSSYHKFLIQSKEVFMYTNQAQLNCTISIFSKSEPDDFQYALSTPYHKDVFVNIDITAHYAIPSRFIILQGPKKTYICNKKEYDFKEAYPIYAETVNIEDMSLKANCGFDYTTASPGLYTLSANAFYSGIINDEPARTIVGSISCRDEFTIVGAGRNAQVYVHEYETM